MVFSLGMRMPYIIILAMLAPIYQTIATKAKSISVFNLTRVYSGDSFFDRWDYFSNYDNLTHGNVSYISSPVNRSASTLGPSNNLTYINDLGNAVIKVDNTSRLDDGQRRNSVRITSQDQYTAGTMWVIDAVHIPFGCSVWPAFWSWGQDWPQGGEIDMIEGVNNQVGNSVAMHTETGCFATSDNSSYSGLQENTNCSYAYNNNSGCSFSDRDPRSYGAAFADAGGGVWVTIFSATDISTWFFQRENIPRLLQNATSSLVINSVDLGLPVARLTNQKCDITKYFSAQSLIFDITLCGVWAGAADTLATTGCDPLRNGLSCYSTYVREPSNYDQAYFEIRSLRVFNLTSQSSTSSAGSLGRGNNSLWLWLLSVSSVLVIVVFV